MSAVRYYVVCDEPYTVGPFKTAEAAERKLVEIERHGHCAKAHRVEEGAR